MLWQRGISVLAACWMLSALAASAYGQGGPGGPGGGQQFDPAMIQQFINQRMQRQLDAIKTQMGSTDDEFTVLQPKIQAIMQLQLSGQIVRFGRMFGGGGGGGGGGGAVANFNFGQPPSELQKAAADLQAAVDDPGSNPQLIANKLAAYRAARDAYNDQLVAAQRDLQQLLTQRQEAVLVLNGLLP